MLNWSPWYNRTGWLGVKHQFTCLLTTSNCLIVLLLFLWNPSDVLLLCSTLFYLTCVLLPLTLCWNCLIVLLLLWWNLSDPKGKFSFYAFIVNNKFLLFVPSCHATHVKLEQIAHTWNTYNPSIPPPPPHPSFPLQCQYITKVHLALIH